MNMVVTASDLIVESEVILDVTPTIAEQDPTQTAFRRCQRLFRELSYDMRQRKIRRFVTDGFTTLVTAKWRWSILFFILQFIFTWLFFGTLYFLFALMNGDIGKYDENVDIRQFCVENVYSFTTALLFSVETQHTIGYGYRHLNPDCPHMVTAVFLQFMVGVGLQCLAIGIVFAKFQLGKRRSDTVLFSKTVCVGIVDGYWSLMLRVGDFSETHLLGVRAQALLIKRSTDMDTGQDVLHETAFNMLSEGGSETLTLFWPIVLHHKIDLDSPFWGSGKPLAFLDFTELVVILDGTVETTSRPMQIRSVYKTNDIAFGYRFQEFNSVLKNGKFEYNYEDLNKIEPAFGKCLTDKHEENNNEDDSVNLTSQHAGAADEESISNLQTLSYLSFALGKDLTK